jgi:uncharacterized membrane protein (UPF0127 family)
MFRALLEKEEERERKRQEELSRELGQVDGPNDTSPIEKIPHPSDDEPDERYPTADLTINPQGRQLKVVLAQTPASRTLGLQALGPDMDGYDGLLMAWPGGNQRATLHNKGVPYPVHASFWSDAGLYRDHFGLLPHDPSPKTAAAPHKYALELNGTTAGDLGIGPESSIFMSGMDDMPVNQATKTGDGTIPMSDRPLQ